MDLLCSEFNGGRGRGVGEGCEASVAQLLCIVAYSLIQTCRWSWDLSFLFFFFIWHLGSVPLRNC